jgi:hypothetical protein
MFTNKSQTDDPKSALTIVADQRNRGYTAWIEDENGKTVDEEALKTDKFIPTKPSLRERVKGLFFCVRCCCGARHFVFARSVGRSRLNGSLLPSILEDWRPPIISQPVLLGRVRTGFWA